MGDRSDRCGPLNHAPGVADCCDTDPARTEHSSKLAQLDVHPLVLSLLDSDDQAQLQDFLRARSALRLWTYNWTLLNTGQLREKRQVGGSYRAESASWPITVRQYVCGSLLAPVAARLLPDAGKGMRTLICNAATGAAPLEVGNAKGVDPIQGERAEP